MTNEARQRLARETGISGGAPVSISDAHRAEMCSPVEAAKPVCHAYREGDRERDSVAFYFLQCSSPKPIPQFVYKTLCDYTNMRNSLFRLLRSLLRFVCCLCLASGLRCDSLLRMACGSWERSTARD
jgi:hypothetical protein